jgi:hypothetical protein
MTDAELFKLITPTALRVIVKTQTELGRGAFAFEKDANASFAKLEAIQLEPQLSELRESVESYNPEEEFVTISWYADREDEARIATHSIAIWAVKHLRDTTDGLKALNRMEGAND